jgi:hypothetical protein
MNSAMAPSLNVRTASSDNNRAQVTRTNLMSCGRIKPRAYQKRQGEGSLLGRRSKPLQVNQVNQPSLLSNSDNSWIRH